MGKLSSWAYSENLNDLLFRLLLLTFPFGSFYLSFSVGFMTIYPNLIIMTMLAMLAFFRKGFPKTKIGIAFLVFLFLMTCISIAWIPFVENKSYALFDTRNVFLFMLTGFVLMSVHRLLGFEKWRIALSESVKIIFILIVCFGFFEYLTGTHFAGATTEKIITRGLMDHAMYSPLYLTDNPNNYLTYVLMYGMIILILEKDTIKRRYLAAVISVLFFLSSVMVISTVGILVSVISMVVVGFLFIRQGMQNGILKQNRIRYSILFVIVSFGIIYLTKEKFYTIPKENQRRESVMVPVYPELYAAFMEAKIEKEKSTDKPVVSSQVAPEKIPERNSEGERMALIKNGLVFFNESKLTGIGPGQYRHRHDSGAIQNYAYGNNGAHFWLIELLSQYGLILFIPYVFLFGWIFSAAFRCYKSDFDLMVLFVLALIVFAAASVLPSAFLTLDINWIFTSVLVVMASEFSSTLKPKENV